MPSKFGGQEVTQEATPATRSRFGGMSAPAEEKGFLESVGDVAGELTGGGLRALGSMADVVLSPAIAAERQIRPYAQAMLGQREMPASPQAAYRQTEPFSFEAQIPERGAFSGEGAVADVAGATG